jgi:hypothetical protein
MKCYTHRSADAVGTCKACCKGVCEACAFDSGNGLACKENCVEEVQAVNEMLSRGKQLYSIGTRGTKVSSAAIPFFVLGTLFGGWGIFTTLTSRTLDLLPILAGFAMVAVGTIVHIRYKRLKLNL